MCLLQALVKSDQKQNFMHLPLIKNNYWVILMVYRINVSQLSELIINKAVLPKVGNSPEKYDGREEGSRKFKDTIFGSCVLAFGCHF